MSLVSALTCNNIESQAALYTRTEVQDALLEVRMEDTVRTGWQVFTVPSRPQQLSRSLDVDTSVTKPVLQAYFPVLNHENSNEFTLLHTLNATTIYGTLQPYSFIHRSISTLPATCITVSRQRDPGI